VRSLTLAPPPAPVQSPDEAYALAPNLRILDVRDAAAFAAGHLAHAGHMPSEDFVERRMELPAREVPVLCVHDDPALAHEAAVRLVGHGFAHVRWLARSLRELPMGHADTGPPARLWSPSPFLDRMLPTLRPGRALDLASGTGRAAVAMALLGHEVEAWDHDAGSLERAEAFAARQGVTITTRDVDLEVAPLERPEPRFDLIVIVRYLHRPLFPWIEDALAPGGTLLMETFLRGQEQYGHPKRARFLLERGEAREVWRTLEVLEYEEDPDTRPPVTCRLCARRPLASGGPSA